MKTSITALTLLEPQKHTRGPMIFTEQNPNATLTSTTKCAASTVHLFQAIRRQYFQKCQKAARS